MACSTAATSASGPSRAKELHVQEQKATHGQRTSLLAGFASQHHPGAGGRGKAAGAGAAQFLADPWAKGADERLQGDGITKIMENGLVFERAGCGFWHVKGAQLPPSATQHRPELAGAPFEAMGVSLVFHPRNPYVPTVHMNVRMIAAGHEGQLQTCWFGGGMDLTPVYGFEEDAVHFHQTCKDALQPFGAQLYPRFKTVVRRIFLS